MHTMVPLVFALLFSGCTLGNLTPRARFSEASFTLNDTSRWGRVDIAATQVSPKYRDQFLTRRQEWGGGIAIADSEVVAAQVAEDRKSAFSEVTVNWYRSDGVTLRTSVIAQKWEVSKGHFLLVDERVRAGDTSVFFTEEEAAADSDPS